jgi:HAD superfamily hydrolase (TIGR01549 family)
MRAIFFDLDDTLCDTNGSRLQRARLASECLACAYPHLEATTLAERILEIDPAHGWPRGVGPLLQDLGIEGSAAGLEARGLWFFQGCMHLLRPWPGVTDLIRRLSRDHVLGVVTNGPEDIQHSKFASLGLEDCFRVFLTSERAGVFKPDAAIFRQALSEAGVEARTSVFVGDAIAVDIAGARAAGMRSVWIDHESRGLLPDDPRPDFTIARFDELPLALDQLA